jgi:hypothetical protein
MAKKKDSKEGNKAKETAAKTNPVYLAAAIIAFVAIVAVSYLVVSGIYSNSNPQNSFSTFRSNFYSAPRVAIYATAYNGTVMSGTVGCATAIIENIVASTQAHRNSSTIDFFIINQTKCTYVSGLGKSNGTETSLAACLNMSGSEPTIYINYSSTDMNPVIKPDYLYISGNSTFLNECGVATELG